ncbi:Papain-like_cysteine peptidase superfamily [Hexamita inflata]|uniref:Papain-like cysteine peptidase superfamily n=1 Tax=Hexamita inflata TaxID=28002 RepID=A0AA86N6W7_9EUKA|nr:Papain-like cysteine peptidase superfamily [Hexamita inflata]
MQQQTIYFAIFNTSPPSLKTSAQMKNSSRSLTQGSILTSFTVYTDFVYYTKGIYQHKFGAQEGSHSGAFGILQLRLYQVEVSRHFPLQLVSEEGGKDRGAPLGYRSLEPSPWTSSFTRPLGGQPEASGETQTTNYNNLKYQIRCFCRLW